MITTDLPATRFRTIDGIDIRYADSGGEHGPVVLLTSPWPESIHAFSAIWPLLAPHARLFAVDLPGFGRSERRDDLLSPRAMGGFLTRLVDQIGLDRPLVVAPDVGTPAALFAGALEPDRFSGLVVGGGGTAYPLQLGEPLASWVLDPHLDRYRSIDPHLVVNTAIDNHADETSDDVRADYLASYEGDRFVESMRYVRRYPEELPVLADLLPRLLLPVTVVTGRNDRVVPPANATYVADRAPRARIVLLDAGHFLWEEVPRQYADAVLSALRTCRLSR
jgi:pimeloyl-ACP methyl ester carboxylesterase